MTNIHRSELEDCDQLLTKQGRSRAEFDFIEDEKPIVGTDVQPTISVLTIRNKKTGAERKYQAGHFSKWVVEFAHDLELHAI
jgi:hypothetical protein